MAVAGGSATWVQIEQRVDQICADVFQTASEVLKSVEHLGFVNLLSEPKPNAEDKMLRVKVVESVFTAIIGYFEQNDKHDLVQKMLNAKQQILHLEMLIYAVKSKDIDESNRLVELLEKQRHI
ncbi:hypothetical protein [Polynucleobacter sp. MWH-UH35A]|uniref:hypothetical protein n=1 Tax=Polynucleobacter sp. MWH-UH35A TaxID=1855619 RepID=UPI001BFD53FF|nr:hypothetical protein [Polynucleobacter sp. MWH-UH35A]QWD60793.1 hypothetical protein ICV36_03660 [Polynucleobacter sp. MWH-UH35A]